MLLRIYQRGFEAAAKEVALLRGVFGNVPVPKITSFFRTNPLTGHPYCVMDWIDGERLDELSGRHTEVARCGPALGKALAQVHAITFSECGFLGPELSLTRKLGFGRDDLLRFIARALREGPGADRLGSQVTQALTVFVTREGHCLGQWSRRCLTHGDLNGSNLLFLQVKQEWKLAAILDWEFAFSGVPGFDFAHLLRPPLDRHWDLGEQVTHNYRVAGGVLPPNWRRIARMTDLFAWIDVLRQPDPDPTMVKAACQVVRSTIEDW
jgi:aminoglycoside phosphotransferase (APT) family kinase protein